MRSVTGKRVRPSEGKKKVGHGFLSEIKALSEITPGAMGILEPISDVVIPKERRTVLRF